MNGRQTIRVLAALALLVVYSVAAAAPVAMVSDLAGAVMLAGAGKTRAAALLTYLEAGTSLRVAPGARVVLCFLAKPLELTLTGPAEATVSADGVSLASGSAPSIRSLEPDRADAARRFEPVQRERLSLATVQMRGGVRPQLVLDGPANTDIYGAAPLLAWNALPGVASYRLLVSDASGKTLLDRPVAQTSFLLEEVALPFGRSYDWRVEARLASGELVSAKAGFSLIDGARARRIAALKPGANAPFSERLLFAAQLESEGLAYEAQREWRSLAAERSGDASLREWAER